MVLLEKREVGLQWSASVTLWRHSVHPIPALDDPNSRWLGPDLETCGLGLLRTGYGRGWSQRDLVPRDGLNPLAELSMSNYIAYFDKKSWVGLKDGGTNPVVMI